MSSKIEVVGWKSASLIAKQLVQNGYQVLIESDGEKLNKAELTYNISFCHPLFEGSTFELIGGDLDPVKTWKSIKDSMFIKEMESCEDGSCKIEQPKEEPKKKKKSKK